MAALDAVAKLNASATPRATFRIIDFFLILKVTAPFFPIQKIGGRKATIGYDKHNDAECICPFMLLNRTPCAATTISADLGHTLTSRHGAPSIERWSLVQLATKAEGHDDR